MRWKPKEYRIKQHKGKFTIQGLQVRTEVVGMLWWRRTEKDETWRDLTETGEYAFGLRYMPDPPKFYDTLDDALDAYELLTAPAVYHPVTKPEFPAARVENETRAPVNKPHVGHRPYHRDEGER